MHYVYLTQDIVTDQCQIDPYSVFTSEYASQFIEAPDEVTFNWSLVNGEWVAPTPAPQPSQQETNKKEAVQRLNDTDWTTIPDVSNPELSNPYLMNADEFAFYRSQVRAIAVNPPETPAVFPEKPNEKWSS